MTGKRIYFAEIKEDCTYIEICTVNPRTIKIVNTEYSPDDDNVINEIPVYLDIGDVRVLTDALNKYLKEKNL